MKHDNKAGFALFEAIIILVVIGLLGVGGWYVVGRNKDKVETAKSEASLSEEGESGANVTWEFDGASWRAMGGTAPTCDDRIPFKYSPVDTSLVTSILPPGQSRGGNYKAHGGFRFDNSQSTDISVKLPLDGQLTGMVRYIEAGELQYLVTFVNDCGLSFRFDHLAALTPAFQALADQTPEPKVDDTRSDPIRNGPKFKAGDELATAVGFAKMSNISVDFGVYDLRNPNNISKNSDWANEHASTKEQTFYGTCWYDFLPKADAGRVWNLVQAADASKSASDYCDDKPGL
jgi:hypothetical protein